MKLTDRLLLGSLITGVALAGAAPAAHACGCFANPSPATPVVQAGERILFAHEGDQVVAHIQIQYSGDADHFGWLVPLPSVPVVELGTDELFTALVDSTRPRYQLTTARMTCDGQTTTRTTESVGCGGGYATSTGGPPVMMMNTTDMNMGEVVVRDSIGPYDYAVLKADDRNEMLTWLADNRFFVPAGIDDAVGPYVHPGAYFLALKLRAGETTGNVQPIIIRYTSDLPMIPIILTQVGAVPDMGIQVWVLGEGRAIPRNYHHVVPNDTAVWLDNAATYPRLLIDAVHEAPARHAFMTDYAGPSSIMHGQLDAAGRFGDLAVLRKSKDASTYVHYLRDHAYRFDSTLLTILERYLPEPDALVAQGVSALDYFLRYDYWWGILKNTPPDAGVPVEPTLDPIALTDEIDLRVVTPTRTAAALFHAHPYLTRLYSALSPIDMNADPVFSINPELPDVPQIRSATLTYPCQGLPWLATSLGFEVQYPQGGSPPVPKMPAALRVEALRESGAPEVETDNQKIIATTLGPVDHGKASGTSTNTTGGNSTRSSGGCNGCTVRTRGDLTTFALAAAALLGLHLTRRRRR